MHQFHIFPIFWSFGLVPSWVVKVNDRSFEIVPKLKFQFRGNPFGWWHLVLPSFTISIIRCHETEIVALKNRSISGAVARKKTKKYFLGTRSRPTIISCWDEETFFIYRREIRPKKRIEKKTHTKKRWCAGGVVISKSDSFGMSLVPGISSISSIRRRSTTIATLIQSSSTALENR